MKTKVLLIEDDVTLQHLLKAYLEDEDFEVLSAPNGPSGLRLAYEHHPHLVLLDIMLPGMDGWEICARLKELSNVPIIMLTAKSAETDKLRGFRLGIDDYVTKPFSFAELVARMRAVLSRTALRQPDQPLLSFGGITLHLERYQAIVQTRSIDLTPTEFRMLEALLRRRGSVARENELAREVWGEYRQKDESLVRKYVLALRKKIEPDPAHPRYILTVRGFGYRISSEDEQENVATT